MFPKTTRKEQTGRITTTSQSVKLNCWMGEYSPTSCLVACCLVKYKWTIQCKMLQDTTTDNVNQHSADYMHIKQHRIVDCYHHHHVLLVISYHSCSNVFATSEYDQRCRIFVPQSSDGKSKRQHETNIR